MTSATPKPSPWIVKNPLRAIAIAAMAIGLFMIASFGLIAAQTGIISDATGADGATKPSELAMLVLGLVLLIVGFFRYGARAPRSRRHRLALLIVAGSLLLGVLVWSVVQGASSVLVHPRQGLGLAYFIPDEDQENVAAPALTGLTDTTSQICSKQLPCIQAYAGNRLTLYRFASQSDAAQFAESLGADGYQSDWIVVKFTDPSLSPELRQYVRERLDGTWGSN